jgi:hypothetical protein
VSTAEEKVLAATSLRLYADWVETALDAIPGLSTSAWDCPAADAFVEGVRDEQSRLRAAASTIRSVADSLEAAAAAQRAAANAAAAVDTEASTDPTPPPPVTSNVM